MKSWMKKGLVALTLGATLATAATPADAQRWYGGRGRTVIVRDRGIGAGGALAVGIAGLAVGAALASNRDRYYYGPSRGYGYYGPRYNYYDRGYYDRGYYGPRAHYGPRGYYDGYAQHCWIERRYDPYSGYPLRVEVCR
ncbi:MAG: hypothetical protein A4S16_10735 [Proteobacteria bacterium SG_bin6]|nr:MAG: hypothetical protein A4S16_10735 [Proteobacteria bacterium SG_bin6]